MKTILTLCLLAFASRLSAQTDIAPPPPPPPPPPPKCDTGGPTLSFAEEMPQFPGGQEAFTRYLQTNIHYPDSAKKYGREGTVYVYFEVRKDGTIQNVKCQKGVPKAPDLCDEAIRVVAAMPNWKPGVMDGKPVTVSMTIPLKFSLH